MRIAKPNRVARSYTQRLVREPARVFPLLCPVREAEWLEGWDPSLVLSHSGVVEPDCVFLTDAAPGVATWYVTQHDPAGGFVEMIKIVPDVTATRLTIHVRAVGSGSEATITYAHTSLGPEGDTFVASFGEEHFLHFMQDWEARVNHYLTHGTMLRRGDGREAS